MSNQQVAHQIINFLKSAVAGKEVDEDYVDSIDVAIDCLAEAFEVDKDQDEQTLQKDFQGKSLKQILADFQTKPAPSVAGVEIPVHVDEEVDEETLKKADELKALGNKAMAARDFEGAVEKYTDALSLTPANAVFLSNRAAAYSSLRKHEEAIKDAKAAIEADATYAKAYSRLGLANYALGKPKEAMDAYKKGLEIEGDNASAAMQKGYETAKARVEEQLGLSETSSTRETPATSSPSPSAGGMPDLSNLASMFGGAGAGAGAGAGGLPNFADMMKNPQLMQMAQQMMQDPNALNNLMSNPAVRQMAQQFGLGGDSTAGSGSASGSEENSGSQGTPDLSSLLNNPALADMAKNMFGKK